MTEEGKKGENGEDNDPGKHILGLVLKLEMQSTSKVIQAAKHGSPTSSLDPAAKVGR